jgi:ribosome-associated protein
LASEEMATESKALLCVNASLEKKARDIVLIDVSEVSSFTDRFIICTGTSSRHTQAIAASIQENMKEAGQLPLGIEGGSLGLWVLLDYDDVVVHVFYEPVREFYDLERLWPDAPRTAIADEEAQDRSAEAGEATMPLHQPQQRG